MPPPLLPRFSSHSRPTTFPSKAYSPNFRTRPRSHWDQTLPVSETLTEELIASGAKELEEIFEIWDKCCKESGQTGATPELVFQLPGGWTSSDKFTEEGPEKRVFEQIIDRFTPMLPCVHEDFYFLDLGCHPESFASFILNSRPLATGIGISAPHNIEGMSFHAQCHNHYSTFGSKFKLYSLDVSRLDMCFPGQKFRQPTKSLNLRQLPEELLPSFNQNSEFVGPSRKFHLVIIDNGISTTSSPDLLLISQILLGLQSLALEGTLVVRLAHPESIKTAKILYMLDTISSTVASLKPREMRGHPGSFYAVAQDVGHGPHGHKMPEIIEELRKLWWKLLTVSATSVGHDPSRGALVPSDLDFLIYSHEMKAQRRDYLDRLVIHGELVWMRQLEMILLAKYRMSKSTVA